MESLNGNLDYEAYYKKQRSRAWLIPAVIGSAVIFIVIFLVFAFVQKTEADKARSSAEEMHVLAMKQQRDAAAHTEAMAQRIKALENELKDCSSK